MKSPQYKSYDELPLFLNANLVAQVLGVSQSSGYELMHEPGFPVLRVGSRMVVPTIIYCSSVDLIPLSSHKITIFKNNRS